MTPLTRRHVQSSGMLAAGAILLVLLTHSASRAADDRGNSSTGTVSGTVVYQADPKRPWRYARYYIKDRRKGLLAESVIALRGRNLKNIPPTRDPVTTRVDQKDFRFVPETVAIRAGDSVRFTNSDNAIHNVKTADGTRPFSVNMRASDEHTQLFDRATGVRRPIRIGCTFHSTMAAWIFVFDHPFYELTESDGRFEFKSVPPGSYRLEMAHPSGRLSWQQTIEVRSGETTTIDVRVSPDNRL